MPTYNNNIISKIDTFADFLTECITIFAEVIEYSTEMFINSAVYIPYTLLFLIVIKVYTSFL
jgi:hypothetical protein